MTDYPIVIGVDPGETTGVFSFHLEDPSQSFARQVAWEEFPMSVIARHIGLARVFTDNIVLAVETFIISSRAGRSSHTIEQRHTVDIVGQCKSWWSNEWVSSVRTYPAGVVKPFCTDRRLAAIPEADAQVRGMKHAKDAYRHALYTAIKHYGYPDPLGSKEN